MYVSSYYTGSIRREMEEREAKREAKQEAHRERVKQKTRAYNNMNYYSTSPEQKKYFETLWKSL